MTRTSNDGPRDASETLWATGPSPSSGRNPSQTRHARQARNASAMMTSDVFMDVFMPPMFAADRGGGQATEFLKIFSAFLSLFLGLLVTLNA